MAEKHLQDFYRRASRYERGYARGQGFEALGALGRAAFRSRQRRTVPLVARILMLLSICLLMKAAMLLQLGPDLYAERVDKMRAGRLVAQIGAVFLQPDPLSSLVARLGAKLF